MRDKRFYFYGRHGKMDAQRLNIKGGLFMLFLDRLPMPVPLEPSVEKHLLVYV